MCARDVYVKIISLCIILCNFILQNRKEQLGSSIVTILEHMSRVSVLRLSKMFVVSEVVVMMKYVELFECCYCVVAGFAKVKAYAKSS